MANHSSIRWLMSAAFSVAMVSATLVLKRVDNSFGSEAEPRDSNKRIGSQTSQAVPLLATKARLVNDEGIFAVAMTPDGRIVATGDQGTMIRLWDATSGKKTKDLSGHEGGITSLDIDPAGLRLASVGFDGIRLWRLPTGIVEHHLPTKRGATTWIRFAPDGRSLASGSSVAGIPIQFWDVETGRELPSLPPNSGGSKCAAYSPDGRWLAVARPKQVDFAEIGIWDMASRQEVVRFSAHRDDIRKLEFTPDGKGIISADIMGELVIWDATSGGPLISRLPDHAQEITALAVSRDGTFLATASRGDQTVHCWEIATGQEISRFIGHEGTVKAVAFSADGRLAVSGGFDSLAFTWGTRPVESFQTSDTTQLTEAEAEQLWSDIRSRDAVAAQIAMDRLAAHSAMAVKFVDSHLQPLTEYQQQEIVHSIGHLDDVRGDVRRQAMDDLTRLGDLAETALREARTCGCSFTKRQRLDALIDMLSQQPRSPHLLSSVRGVQLLERIGTPEAKRVLLKLERGPGIDLCTVAAATAIRRLDRLTSTTSQTVETEPVSKNHKVPQAVLSAPTEVTGRQGISASQNVSQLPQVQDVISAADELDRMIENGWKENGIVAAPIADDAEWLRRVSLDLTGRIPLAYEVQDFADDTTADKRPRVIEHLLNSPEFIGHQVTVWRTTLMGLPKLLELRSRSQVLTPAMERWLEDCLRENRGYDSMIRTLLTLPLPDERQDMTVIQSAESKSSPIGFYFRQDTLSPAAIAGDCSRLFLGLNLECAQCHDHPFASWKREQFWEMAAFFSGIRSTIEPVTQFPRLNGEDPDEDSLSLPDSDKLVKATFLDGQQPERRPSVSTRQLLAEWITAPENPYFARATVNRVWAQFFGAGLGEPLDDVNDGTASGHLELIEMLAQRFKAKQFDLRFLIRVITLSRAYQRSSRLTHDSQRDTNLLAKMPVRSLTMAQLYDSLVQASGYGQHLVPIRREWRYYDNARPSRVTYTRRFANTLPQIQTETSMLDALFLMNGPFMETLSHPRRDEMLDTFGTNDRASVAENIKTLYLAVLSRWPQPDESARMAQYVESRIGSSESRTAFAEIFWALVNCGEFMSNH